MNQRFPDLSNEAYHSRDEISSTQMKELLKSIAHYEWSKSHSKSSTISMLKGSAIHIGCLEPHLFESSVIVSPKWRTTKEDKAKKEAFLMDHADKIILDEESFEEVCQIIEQLKAHPTVCELLSDGVAEHSFIWKDTHSGLGCRCRPDFLPNHLKKIIDLKTTQDASYQSFSKTIVNLGYHISAAMYLDGVSEVEGVEVEEFVFVVAETKPPYSIAIYNLHEDAIAHGRSLYQGALQYYANYLRKKSAGQSFNIGYPAQVQQIQIPFWGFDQAPPVEERKELKARVGNSWPIG